MLALIAILLLIPVVIIHILAGISQLIIIIYMLFSTAFIIKEYLRRMRYANIVLKNVIAANLICLVAFLVYVFH